MQFRNLFILFEVTQTPPPAAFPSHHILMEIYQVFLINHTDSNVKPMVPKKAINILLQKNVAIGK